MAQSFALLPLVSWKSSYIDFKRTFPVIPVILGEFTEEAETSFKCTFHNATQISLSLEHCEHSINEGGLQSQAKVVQIMYYITVIKHSHDSKGLFSPCLNMCCDPITSGPFSVCLSLYFGVEYGDKHVGHFSL